MATNPNISKGKQRMAFETGNLPWVEKYRPASLDQVIAHEDIVATISKFMDENKLPHLLFYGPPGTGKTSTILACARKLYGDRYKNMILELNASDDRGIDVVREQIKNFASAKTLFSNGFKLIILDEADNMTQAAQNALRRVIEKYTKNVRFCIICNYVSKIIPAIQSRCTRFRFSPLGTDQIQARLDHVIQQEGINITPEGQKALVRLSIGDMRRALNILQSTHAAFSLISEETVYTCTGSPLPADIEQVANWLFGLDFTQAYSSMVSLLTPLDIARLSIEKGLALTDIITELVTTLTLMEIPAHVRVFLLDNLADIEYNLAQGCGDKVQLGAMVGVFKLAVEMAQKK